MVCELGFEVCDVRCGAFLSRRAAGDGITPPDLSLDAVEVTDTLHALFGNRRRAGPVRVRVRVISTSLRRACVQ
ncbi:hypothetical protein rosmuc_03628 [Roseovarius mucosus DSM 17069]|uniref:Uncharacterized protein n=1 Tax=Roseovarius mucosus DSM 17069 TaxID=1288298 RepID=A0A0A0HHQ9_9RHOB|nr:hypothetical protein rosmuc_03628 [Roseovarius mucosus DSM 17069]